MKQLLYTSLLLLFFSEITAQMDTTEWVYQFHNDHYHNTYSRHLSLSLLKIDNSNYYDPNFFLFAALREYTDSNTLQEFKDKACTNVFSKEETKRLFYQDYILTFDPETFEEVKYPIDDYIPFPSDTNRHYKLSQAWYFDSTTHQLQSTIENCAIVSFYATIERASIKTDTLIRFYLHNDQTTGNWTDNWNEDNIIWKVRTTTQGWFKHKTFSDYLLQEVHLKQHKLLYRDERYRLKPANYNFIQEHFTSWSDTVTIYGGKKVIDVYPILEKVRQYTVVQEFSFNKVTKVFSSRVIAIAPIGTTGHYSGNIPLFWIVYDKDYIPSLR